MQTGLSKGEAFILALGNASCVEYPSTDTTLSKTKQKNTNVERLLLLVNVSDCHPSILDI